MIETSPDTYWSLFWAYSAIWALVLAYCLSLGRKQRQQAAEISELKCMLKEEATANHNT